MEPKPPQSATPHLARWGPRAFRFFAEPPWPIEIGLWFFLIGTVISIHVYLIQLLPVHLWSQDAGSYAAAAWRWMQTGEWETDPRRGPVYSLLIAACLKAWGEFDTLMVLQHVLAGIAVLAGMVVLRLEFGRRAIIPLAFCGYAYALYGLPIYMAHLIRNETLLFFFATFALLGWFLSLRRGAGWLWLAGISAGLLTLTKNVFLPFPLVVLGGIVWLHWGQWRVVTMRAASFLVALVLPFLGAKILHRVTIHDRPPEPQSGLLLFGRVAQFTVLDGGIEPEVKALIRQDVENYRAHIQQTGKLENNIPLNRTAVPRMRAIYLQQGKTPSDLNRLFRRIAIEAIQAHPWEYALQMWKDFCYLQIKTAARAKDPDVGDVTGTLKTLETVTEGPGMNVATTIEALKERADKQHFRKYRRKVLRAWLFNYAPGLLTSIAVTLLVFLTRGRSRLWWLGLAVIWWFTMLLLCTVGRPLNRYLMPAVPVMFWSLSAMVILAWIALLDLLQRLFPRATVESTTAP